MFTCTACFRRALQNLTAAPLSGSSLSANPSRQTALPSPLARRLRNDPKQTRLGLIPSRRSHATLASLKRHHREGYQQHHKKDGKTALPPPNRAHRQGARAIPPPEIKDAVARENNRKWFDQDRDDNDLIRPSQLPEPSRRELAAASKAKVQGVKDENEERRLLKKDQREVETYYKDPLQLAQAVLQRLRVPDIKGALRLVKASETFAIKNIVSWNHCMDWLMSQGQYKESLRVYNDMKKRGHMPDAHTYTIMLRGLSENVHKPDAVQEAIKIYNSIFAPNSAVKPSIIHTNAIINVCARGRNMDALWGIAGRLPEKGPGSPDRLTYTLILNAIRENTIKEAAKTAEKGVFDGDADAAHDAREKLFGRAIADGKKLWEGISFRWRRADMVIDEQLVCAMGRLLVTCGVGKDIEQVLDLLETTMNIRIAKRKTSAVPINAGATVEDRTESEPEAEPEVEPALPLQESTVYAEPGRKTLALLLEAARLHHTIRTYADAYWDLLTSPTGRFRIQPDAANIQSYLRILRVHRASSRVYEVLSHDWPPSVTKSLYRRGTFVIALSTCVRDKNNPNVFATAQKLLDLMQTKLDEQARELFEEDMALDQVGYHERKKALKQRKTQEAAMTVDEREDRRSMREYGSASSTDPKILDYFLQLAVSTTQGWAEGIRGKDDGSVFERDPAKNHTLVALDTLKPYLAEIKGRLKKNLERWQENVIERQPVDKAIKEQIKEALILTRTVISAYDKVTDIAERFVRQAKSPIDEKIVSEFNSLKREYTAYMARVERFTGKLSKAPKRSDADEHDEDDESDRSEPWAEQRIRAIPQEVDQTILNRRAAEKARDVQLEDPKPRQSRLKILGNRKLDAQRRNLLGHAMSREIPGFDFGILDDDLNVVTAEKRAEVDAKQAATRDSHYQRAGPAAKRFRAQEEKPDFIKRREEITKRAGADWLLKQQQSKILEHEEVRHAFGG